MSKSAMRTTKNLNGVDTGSSLAPAALRKMVPHVDSLGLTGKVSDPRPAVRNTVGKVAAGNPRLTDRVGPAARVPNAVRPLPAAKNTAALKGAMARRLKKNGATRMRSGVVK